MQKRFCSCGHMIVVRYQRRMGVWLPQVIENKKVRNNIPLPSCPACGTPISIHSLR
jgi:hypothetical protein